MKNNEVSLADEWRGEFVEGVKRLRSDLGKIKKSWDNRLAAKRCPFSEVYLNGDADIVLYGNRLAGEDRVEWVVRIAADLHVLESVGARDGVYVFDIYDGCARNKIPVFITVAHSVNAPKVVIPSFVRLYVFKNVNCKVGEGLLYGSVVRGGYKSFPFFMEGEVGFSAAVRLNLCDNVRDPIVKGLSHIVDGVAYHAAQGIADWLFGPVGKAKSVWLCENRDTETTFDCKFIKVLGEGRCFLGEGINVAIGPFDLRPC